MAEHPFRLDGRVALITGGGSATGIGHAIARAYARAGASIALGDVDVEGARANADALRGEGVRALGLALDVTSEESVAAAVAEVAGKLGPIDILVNNAGITSGTPLVDLGVAEYDRLMAINLRGAFLCLKAVIPGMIERGHGRVIWMSSVAGKQGGGVFGTSHYAASKAGMIGLCQGAARELAPHGITSNAIAPAMVLTGLVARTGGPEVERAQDERNRHIIPVGRSAVPEDIAAAALYLASDEASYVTGEVLDVNGGLYFD